MLGQLFILIFSLIFTYTAVIDDQMGASFIGATVALTAAHRLYVLMREREKG